MSLPMNKNSVFVFAVLENFDCKNHRVEWRFYEKKLRTDFPLIYKMLDEVAVQMEKVTVKEATIKNILLHL